MLKRKEFVEWKAVFTFHRGSFRCCCYLVTEVDMILEHLVVKHTYKFVIKYSCKYIPSLGNDQGKHHIPALPVNPSESVPDLFSHPPRVRGKNLPDALQHVVRGD
ncbi:hypothetical protein V1264_022493 [Littorina saxatilis]|uniref:Uncharacterized protein n=1 Tax=Littorina saxatilis TaxID=31220 RepID=A0AAN9AKK5_9CAEN